MAELPGTARTVIIGGGAVGASCLFHLAKKGWTDSLLLEKNELTSGSTWHAAGNVPTFSASWSVMNMQRYSAELYRGLADEVDYPMNYHVTGSIRLAHSDDRMKEFERVVGMGRYQGMDVRLCTVEELKDHYPFLETHDLAGALHDPYDGDIDPAQLTQALAKGARDLGARVIRFCPVTGVRRQGGEWVVATGQGEVRCEYVVNAAGYRGREVGAMFGRSVPMVAMSHQYLLTEPIPAIEEWSRESGRKLPLLRDVDTSWYLRQEKFGLNLGPYERNCQAHWVTSNDPMPEDFSFQLYPDDLDRLEWYVEDAVARVPLLGEGGVSRVINGPIPYTPDGNPLIGPMPGVPAAFEACVFTFGIAQAGGAGKVLAEWVVDGGTEWDMWSCDPRRFMDYADQDHALAKAVEVYGHEYAMHFPHHAWPAGRDKRLSPVHDRIRDLGAQFGAYGGWERANWFAREGDDTSESATQTWSREGPWFPRIREECLAVRDAAGILDLPGFSRFHVRGPGAADWLRTLVTGSLPRVGRVGLVYFSDDRGRIVTEMSVTRLGDDEMLLITAGRRSGTTGTGSCATCRPARPSRSRTGPRRTPARSSPARARATSFARERRRPRPSLARLAAVPGSRGREVLLLRVSYVGELGWEIHSEVADTPADLRRGAGGWGPGTASARSECSRWTAFASRRAIGRGRATSRPTTRSSRAASTASFAGRSPPSRGGAPSSASASRDRDPSFRDPRRGCRGVRRALHVDGLEGRRGRRRDDLGRLGPPGGGVHRPRHGALRSRRARHRTRGRDLRRTPAGRGAARPPALRPRQREAPELTR